MPDWNPNTPDLVGLEWFPARNDFVRLRADSNNAAVIRHPSTAVETIDDIAIYMLGDSQDAYVTLEVYPAGNLPHPAATTDTHRPNVDLAVVIGPNAEDEGGATTNLWQSVDEAVLDLTDYVTNTTALTPMTAQFGTDSTGYPAGRHVLQVRWVAVVENLGEACTLTMQWRSAAATDRTVTQQFEVPANSGVITFTVTFAALSDATVGIRRLLWRSDIGGAGAAEDLFLIFSGLTLPQQVRLYQTYTEVDRVAETREAVADTLTVNADGWQTWVAFRDPDDGSGTDWSKTVQDYDVVVRRLPGDVSAGLADGGGQPRLPLVAGDTPPVVWQAAQVLFADDGRIDTLDLDDEQVAPLVLQTTGAATSDDSQPYAFFIANTAEDITFVHADNAFDAEQQFTAPATTTVRHVRVLVGGLHPLGPDADLTVSLHLQSSGAFLASTTIDAADLNGSAVQQLTGLLDNGVPLTSGTQYFLRYTSQATAARGWRVGVVFTVAPAFGESENFGGTTDRFRGTFNGGLENSIDAPFVLGGELAAPTGLTAVVVDD